MHEIFSKKYYRRPFFMIVALAILLLLATRFFVLPYFDETLGVNWPVAVSMLSEKIVVSLIITIAIPLTIYILYPRAVREPDIEVIGPKEIRPLLLEAVDKSDKWMFKGACGRYTRATTLPRMVESARLAHSSCDLELYLIDPMNEEICLSYAEFRNSLPGDGGWTSARVQGEVIATILSAARADYKAILDVEVYLLQSFSVFRLDVSDNYVIVTKEDKAASGLKADKGGFFYVSYVDDLRLLKRQSRKLDISLIEDLADELSLKVAIQAMELLSVEQVESIDLSYIAGLLKDPRDPYG